ncbi:MAG TPA: hypothetical protein VF210_17570 [Pseudomonadales bacterium]
MKRFLAIYTGNADARQRSGWDALDPATRGEREQAGMTAWGAWMERNQRRIVEAGGPLGRTKRVTAAGIEDFRNQMTGYVVVEAESHEEAARLFENHPHFAIFPGEGVEIMECLPIPTA